MTPRRASTAIPTTIRAATREWATAGDSSSTPAREIVDGTANRRAHFDRSGSGSYATTFPPEALEPFSIDTLGEIMTDDAGRLIVLGGHGRTGSEKSGPGEPHISRLRQQ